MCRTTSWWCSAGPAAAAKAAWPWIRCTPRARRYIESFSAYTRQFLERLEKPKAERIDGIPPAIAVSGGSTSRSSRSTVGTATEVADYLRLLFAKIGHVFCQQCGHEVHCDTPQSTADVLAGLPDGTRYLVAFPVRPARVTTARARPPRYAKKVLCACWPVSA